MIPDECYKNDLDDDTGLATYIWASKIDTIVVLDSLENKIETNDAARKEIEPSLALFAEEGENINLEVDGIEEDKNEDDSMRSESKAEEDAKAKERHTKKLRAKIRRENHEFDKLIKQQEVFNLEVELKQIDCSEYYTLLRDAGYDEKGAFAFLDESAIIAFKESNKMRIPQRPRRRIMALADLYRRQIELDYAAETTALSDINMKFNHRGGSFTYDGKNFYPNKREMVAAYSEAEKYADILKVLEIDKRNR